MCSIVDARTGSVRVFLIILVAGGGLTAAAAVEANTMPPQPEVGMAGDFSGHIYLDEGNEKVKVGLSVTEVGEDEYEAVLYFGGLSWEQDADTGRQKTVKLFGTYTDYTLRLTGDFPLVFQFIHGRYTALDDKDSYRGHLEKVIRVKANI